MVRIVFGVRATGSGKRDGVFGIGFVIGVVDGIFFVDGVAIFD